MWLQEMVDFKIEGNDMSNESGARCEYLRGKGGVCAADAALEFPVDKSELDVGFLEQCTSPVEQIYKLMSFRTILL